MKHCNNVKAKSWKNFTFNNVQTDRLCSMAFFPGQPA